MSKLSKVLKEARLAKGWSQTQVAERSGVPLPSVNRYENPKWNGAPNRENVILIARVLDIPDDKILPAVGFPLRYSGSEEERDKRFHEVAALAADDPRFDRIAELYQGADDTAKDRALSMLEMALGKPAPPARRRRSARQ